MLALRTPLSALVIGLTLGSAGVAHAGCDKDVDCKGARICVDSRCVEPALTEKAQVVAPLSTAAAPMVATAPAPGAPQAPVVYQANPPADSGLLASSQTVWSVSLMAGLDNVGVNGGSEAVFHPASHLELGLSIPTDLVKGLLCGYFDGGFAVNNGNALGLSDFGAAVGVGERYRLTVGGGVALLNNFAQSALFIGGTFMVHGSVALTQHIGVHAQFTATWIESASFVIGGFGLGYQS